MKQELFAILSLAILPLLLSAAPENHKQTLYLSGKGFNDTKIWEFFCTGGRNSGHWTKIEVPSCWEQQGFGNYEYGRNSYSFGPKYKYADEKGLYKLNFQVPVSWKGKRVNIVFEGSMTDTEVMINGKSAGEIHRGSFYRFKYDITDNLLFGSSNLLEVTVSKLSSDESVNRAERYGDYWELMWSSEKSAGGFLWALIDEGLSRTDMKGFIDTDGVNAPDGVMGPHREKEGSFYAIREIFSPVHVTMNKLPPDFTGVIAMENRYHFTNLNKCSFSYKLVDFNMPSNWLPGYRDVDEIILASPDVNPGATGDIRMTLPDNWKSHNALLLTARDPSGNEIYNWTWKIAGNNRIIPGFVKLTGETKAESSETDSTITLRANGTSVTFSKISGKILRVVYNNRTNLMFTDGPVLTNGSSKLKEISKSEVADTAVLEIKYEGNLNYTLWKMHPSGWLSLDYQYELTGQFQFAGISFSFPENYVARAKWLGDGSKLATGLTTDASVYGPAGKPTEMSGPKKHKLWFYFGIPD